MKRRVQSNMWVLLKLLTLLWFCQLIKEVDYHFAIYVSSFCHFKYLNHLSMSFVFLISRTDPGRAAVNQKRSLWVGNYAKHSRIREWTKSFFSQNFKTV